VLKPFAETTEAEFVRLVGVNALGAFLLCKAIVPLMERQRGGHIIALPGILGRAPMAQAAAYCASKYALTGMLKSLALETKRAGVRFSLLHLGGVDSSFWDQISMRVQRDKMLTVEAAARAVFFAASQEGEGVVGELVLQPESHQL
jgi:NAD(P)-dependent dehydrogenase (short-subunit alcohol dehydrogenase family)